MISAIKPCHDFTKIEKHVLILDYYLYNPTTVSVSTKFIDLSLERVDDERQGLRVHLLNTFLYHVVTILIKNALEDVSF